MSEQKEMTDHAAWTSFYLAKYRAKSKFMCMLTSIIFLPFCLIHWAALEGEAAMQVSGEARDDQ